MDCYSRAHRKLEDKGWVWLFTAYLIGPGGQGAVKMWRGVQLCMHLHRARICWQQSSAAAQAAQGRPPSNHVEGHRPAELSHWSASWIPNKSALWHVPCWFPHRRGGWCHRWEMAHPSGGERKPSDKRLSETHQIPPDTSARAAHRPSHNGREPLWRYNPLKAFGENVHG